MSRPRIFFIGTGLGNDLRGIESHIQSLFDHVKKEKGFEGYLLKGGGRKKDREICIINAHRKSIPARFLASFVNRNPHVIQQLTFFLALIPVLFRIKPAVLYFGEPVLFNYLYKWRKISGLKFKMIFFTGGNTVPLKMGEEDFLQLVSPATIDLAKQRGVHASQMKVIPHFLTTQITHQPNKSALKSTLNIPNNKRIILSVGAVDSSVKRMDYLINEVSHLSDSCYLIILGEEERETSLIKKLAEEKLGAGNFFIGKAKPHDLASYYDVADVFVLASLQEGFGMVTIEAMAHGLPVLVHDYETSRFVLGDKGLYADFSVEGNLTTLIKEVISIPYNSEKFLERKNYANSCFSWEVLSKDYLDMLAYSVR